MSREGSSCSETVGAIESVGVNGSDRVWSAIIGRVITESGTHMAVGNQRAALINKQLDGATRGGAGRGEAGRHTSLYHTFSRSHLTKRCAPRVGACVLLNL